MHASLQNTMTVFKRELKAYFESPVAYVFLIVFLVLIGFLTFSVSSFYERRMADLQPFFFWHPWVYLLLVPAATMSLWAEERRSGTIELLLTMPVTMLQAITGKFLAAWLFIVIAIALTIPVMVGTVLYLGSPDMGVIVTGYAGSFLLAGGFAAVGMLTSAVTKNQVISFVLALLLCLLLVLAGWEPITQFFVRWAPAWLISTVTAIGFMPHYDSLQRGVLDLADVIYFLSVMLFMIMATHLVLDNRKSA